MYNTYFTYYQIYKGSFLQADFRFIMVWNHGNDESSALCGLERVIKNIQFINSAISVFAEAAHWPYGRLPAPHHEEGEANPGNGNRRFQE